MTFKKVAELNDLWSGEMVGLEVDGRKVLLINFNDTIYAYENKCAHQGVKLSEGLLTENRLICSAHFWKYDVCTGRGVNPQGVKLNAFAVKVENGNILLDIDDSGSSSHSVDPIEFETASECTSEPDSVGPVLEKSHTADATIAAIRQLNREVEVQDRGAYFRVLVPRQCTVTREAIERNLGESFELPGDLEKIMPSFKGIFAVSQNEATWSFQKGSN